MGGKKSEKSFGDGVRKYKGAKKSTIQKVKPLKKLDDTKRKYTGEGLDSVGGTYADILENPSGYWKKLETKYGGRSAGSSDKAGNPVDAMGKKIKLPAYSGIVDAKGNLLDKYKSNDTAPWLQMQLGKEDLQRGNLIDQSNQKSLSATTGALSNLASTGGLRSGARERIAKSGVRDQALAAQGVNLQSNLNKINLESDAFDKAQAARQFDVANMLQDKQLGRAGDLYKYGEQMKAWGAGKQGDAIAKSGKK